MGEAVTPDGRNYRSFLGAREIRFRRGGTSGDAEGDDVCYVSTFNLTPGMVGQLDNDVFV